MKYFNSTLLALASLVCAGSTAHGEILAGPLVNPQNNHSYYLISPATWTEAQVQAVALGGNLATINDAEECRWIFETFCFFEDSPRPLWIGLTDRDQEGKFRWISGEPATFVNWHPGEPNNNAGLGTPEHYAFVFPSAAPNGGWRDATAAAASDTDENPARWNTGPDAEIGCYGLVEVNANRATLPRAPVVKIERAGRNVKIHWLSESSRRYELQSSSRLRSPDWVLVGNLIQGNGGIVETILPADGEAYAFFRVVAR